MVCLLKARIWISLWLACQRAATALADSGVNIKSAGFALRKVNLQFLVAREDFDAAIIALNRAMN